MLADALVRVVPPEVVAAANAAPEADMLGLGLSAPVVRFAPASMPADPALLSPTELARRDRLRRSADRTSYVAAHVLVRECVAELLGTSVESVRIVQVCPTCGPDPGHGPPSVAGRPDVGVSLSHSGGHVAAIAAHGPVGIDVETIGESRIVESALSERERAWVAGQAEPGRAFCRLWVRKEALIKTGAATLDDAASLDVLARDASGALEPDDGEFTQWSAPDAVGAWTVGASRVGARTAGTRTVGP